MLFVPLPQTNFSPSPLPHLGGVPSHSVSPAMSPATAPLWAPPLSSPVFSQVPSLQWLCLFNISGTRHQGVPVGHRTLPVGIRAIWGCLWLSQASHGVFPWGLPCSSLPRPCQQLAAQELAQISQQNNEVQPRIAGYPLARIAFVSIKQHSYVTHLISRDVCNQKHVFIRNKSKEEWLIVPTPIAIIAKNAIKKSFRFLCNLLLITGLKLPMRRVTSWNTK